MFEMADGPLQRAVSFPNNSHAENSSLLTGCPPWFFQAELDPIEMNRVAPLWNGYPSTVDTKANEGSFVEESGRELMSDAKWSCSLQNAMIAKLHFATDCVDAEMTAEKGA